VRREGIYFCREGWTGQISLIGLEKLVSSRIALRPIASNPALLRLGIVHSLFDFIGQPIEVLVQWANISRLVLSVARSRISAASAASLRSFSMDA
jgi:hypothetical protein